MVGREYRWAASLDLKQPRNLAAAIFWNRLFNPGIVYGKKDIRLYLAST